MTSVAPNVAAVLAAFAAVPSPVAVVAAGIGGARHGMVTSSISTGVSLDPPMIAFAVRSESATWPLLRAAQRLGVSVLAQGHDAISHQIAMSPAASRFEGIPVSDHESGAVLIEGAPVQLVCRVDSTAVAGDHRMVFLEIEYTSTDETIRPLVYHQKTYRALDFAV